MKRENLTPARLAELEAAEKEAAFLRKRYITEKRGYSEARHIHRMNKGSVRLLRGTYVDVETDRKTYLAAKQHRKVARANYRAAKRKCKEILKGK